MEFKREIFFRKPKQESSEEGFVFDIDNCNLSDKKTQEYLEKLKEEDLFSYYSILEQLTKKGILKINEKQKEEYLSLDELDTISENPSDDLYNRFNKIAEEKNNLKKKQKKVNL